MKIEYKKYIIILSLLIFSILSIFVFDNIIAIFINNNISTNIHNIIEYITHIASFCGIAIINILLLLYYIYKKDNNKRNIILYGILVQLLTSGIIQILKFIFGRTRPYHYIAQNIISNSFTFFNFEYNFVSFPSGHSAGIFALVAILFYLTKNTLYKKLLLLFAILIASTRIILNVHFLSDVIFGSTIGFLISNYLFLKLYYNKHKTI